MTNTKNPNSDNKQKKRVYIQGNYNKPYSQKNSSPSNKQNTQGGSTNTKSVFSVKTVRPAERTISLRDRILSKEPKIGSFTPKTQQKHSSPRKNTSITTSVRSGKYKQRITESQKHTIPALADGNIRVITLGGFEEIGNNMIAYEIGDDIIVVDCGFSFKTDGVPGVDYTLPNTKYLEDRKDKIRAVVITHGHLDHIGGIPYVWPRIGNPKIYCLPFTKLMIQKRQEEFKHLPPIDIQEVDFNDRVKAGNQNIRFYGITHTIPDSMGMILETPYGNIINQADFKLDHIDEVISDEEVAVYSKLAKEKTLLLMADSTNIENSGFSTPEWKVARDLDTLIKEIPGRIFIATFASQLERIVKMIESAEKYGRNVVIEGRTMKTNIALAIESGILKVQPHTIISAEESLSLPPHKVLILATGAQGDEFGALMRISNKSHKIISFTEQDSVVLSSSIIPGNENSVQKLKDKISRTGAKIITYRNTDLYVHGTGHGNREELRWLHKTLKPQFFIPQHGFHYLLRSHYDLAIECGMEKNSVIVADTGSIIEIQNKGEKIVKLKETAPHDIVTVDGFDIGNVQDVVIRDRQVLSEEGIFIVVLAINPRTGGLRKSPDIISRGFVYLRESKDLIQDARDLVISLSEKAALGPRPINFENLKDKISDQLRKLLLQKTAKRPLVIPVILGI